MSFQKTAAGTDTWQVALTMGVAMLLGFFAVAVSLYDAGTVWRGLMWAGAWSASGWFLGFIFGIPRYLSTDTARKPAALTPDAAKKCVDDASANVDAKASDQKALEQKAAASSSADDMAAAAAAAEATATARTALADAQSASDKATQSNSSAQSLTVNTNLEQISDWLTKIIVGVSLVESQTLLANLKSAALFMALSMEAASSAVLAMPGGARAAAPAASAIASAVDTAGSGAALAQALVSHVASASQATSDSVATAMAATPMSSFAYAIILYFLTSGLLGSYLLTRLYLQSALDNAAHS